MSTYRFGSGDGAIDGDSVDRIDEIARRHGATFTSANTPEGPRFWFSCRAQGAPFDGQAEAAVWGDLKAAGLARDRRLTCVEREEPNNV